MIEYPEEQEHLVARRREPPDALPTKENTKMEELSLFGKTNFSSGFTTKRYVFGIKRTDRPRNLYIIGKSGVGRTSLLEHLIRSDIFFGHGVCLFDPYGDLVNNLLDFIPENRLKDVVIIDPNDRNFPIAFNPLTKLIGDECIEFTNDFIDVFKQLHGFDWNPRIEYLLRYTTLAMADYPDGTMEGMVLLLTNQQFRARVTKFIRNVAVRRFFEIDYPTFLREHERKAVMPLMNALSQLLTEPRIRNIFSQHDDKIELEQCVKQNKIILIHYAKGMVSDFLSSLFGSLFISELKRSGIHRSDLPSEERPPFYIYVDEFQHLQNPAFEHLINMSRKFNMPITLCNESLGKLSDSFRTTVLGNVDSMVTFQIPFEEARYLKPVYEPFFSVQDMVNLAQWEMYVKLMIDGKHYNAFSADVLPVTAAKYASKRTQILDRVHATYATPRVDVEKAMGQSDRLFLSEV